ncbi:MAG TPA: hypothetical protein VMZ26_12935 [Pyrinomonadaceae bacterium]|nr:hypothetical protein [Pyrinomonadaceae bacterium]
MKIYAAVLIAVVAFLAIPAEASKWEGQVVTKTKVTTKRVSHKTKVKTKKVAHRTKRGTQHIYSKTAVKTRPVRRATWHTGRKVVSRTKKIFN